MIDVYRPLSSVAITKKMFIFGVMLLSVLLASYGPMATYSHAQSAATAQLQSLKEKALDELDRRIAKYQKSLDSLNVDVEITKDVSNVSNDDTSVTGTTFTYTEDGIAGTVALPSDTQGKVKQITQKLIDQLKGLRNKVSNATSLKTMQNMAQNIDAQYDLGKLTDVQATATQAIESMTGVLDGLKTAFNNIQSQVTKLKNCADSGNSGEGCPSGTASDLNAAAQQDQSQLDNLSSVIGTVSTIVASAITLLVSLVAQYMDMLGGLGSQGGIGNLGNIGNMLSSGQLTSLTKGLGGIDGLSSSYTAITSQLDIGNFMSGNALGGLMSLSNSIDF